jgi:hypothetical protein
LLHAILEYQKRERRYGGLSAGPDAPAPVPDVSKPGDEAFIEELRPS